MSVYVSSSPSKGDQSGTTDVSAHAGASARCERKTVHTGDTSCAVSESQDCARPVGYIELTVLEALARPSPTNAPCKLELDKSISASHSSSTGAAASFRKDRHYEDDGVWLWGRRAAG